MVKLGDIKELANKIALVLSNKDLRISLGKRAKTEALLRFKSEIIAEKTYEVYREIINNNPK